MNTENTPVVIFVYRKYEFLDELFDTIIQYSPKKLYIIQDFAKDKKDLKRVQRVRNTISKRKFPFETEIIFQKEHLGTFKYFQAGLDYVFTKEEQLIILEDDTIPTPSFFSFCNSMLTQYRRNDQIGSIIGCNFNSIEQQNTYFLSSSCTLYWGWATWKEKWELNTQENFTWNECCDKVMSVISETHKPFFKNAFDYYKDKNNQVPWDIRWNWVLLANNQKIIIPGMNLITNKGFMPYGTYTNYKKSNFNSLIPQNFDKNKYALSTDSSEVNKFDNAVRELYGEIIDRQTNSKTAKLQNYKLFIIFNKLFRNKISCKIK